MSLIPVASGYGYIVWPPRRLDERAMVSSKTLPAVFDGHNDALIALGHNGRGGVKAFFERGDCGHLDLLRAFEGGFNGGLFAIMPSNDPAAAAAVGIEPPAPADRIIGAEDRLDPVYARRFTVAAFARLLRLERASAGRLRIVCDADALRACFEEGTVAVVAHFEGAEAITPEAGFADVDVFYAAGLRSLGLVWSRPNAFGHGVPFKRPGHPDVGPGLTEAGQKLVSRCNELGIAIDCAHLNERGFWDVVDHSEAPVIVSHSAAHTLCPSSRNLTDSQLDAVADNDGIVGVTFNVADLHPSGLRNPDLPIGRLVDHVEYLVDRMGVDHVGFGSDFDGGTIPRAIGDVTGLSRVIETLRERGYDDSAVRKITHESWLRTLEETWR